MNKRLMFALAMALCLPAVSGCMMVVAGGAGAGTVAYVKGELKAMLEAPLSRSIKATNSAIRKLEYIKISETSDALAARFIVRNAQDKKIEINLNKASERTTNIAIRVGMFGDQYISNHLLNEINKRL